MLIGATLAAAVGPITILYIRRAIAEGWWSGFATAAGAATADAVYASIAAFGLTAISGLLVGLLVPIRLFGGLFLLYIGYKTLRAVPGAAAEGDGTVSLARHYGSTFLLTLTNPMTILMFAGIFAGAGLAASSEGGSNPLALVLGVVCGSLGMATLLVTVSALLGTRVTPRVLLWINRVAGVIICGYAIYTLLGLFTA